MKKMARKNLFYSVLLAAVMLAFLIGYFILMLPSLYVAHMKEQDLESVKRQHRAFVTNGSYEGIQVKNPTACMSCKIPFEGDSIELTTKLVSLKLTAQDAEIKQLLKELQSFIRDRQEGDSLAKMEEQIKGKMQGWEKRIRKIGKKNIRLPIGIEVLNVEESDAIYHGESLSTHVSGQVLVLEANIADAQNEYTNYLAMEEVADGIVFTVLPVVTPQMGEIKPVVLQSLPMLGAVILVIVFLFSKIYSNGIVSPALHTIEGLYAQVQMNYEKLKAANKALLEENERQEMFLRACSHQLKTPITAALLLTDGMIQQVGKYKDTTTYLPKVKQQLLWMQKMTADILSLNYGGEEEECCLYTFLQKLLAPYHIKCSEKNLHIDLEGNTGICVKTDVQLLSKIVDNLLSNAVNYSPFESSIRIVFDDCKIWIRNEGTSIPEELLQHIFEPFARGSRNNSSHGLGLYIAAYCAKRIGAELTVQNKDGGVEAELCFKQLLF